MGQEWVSLGWFEWLFGIFALGGVSVLSGIALRLWNHETRLAGVEMFAKNDPTLDDARMAAVVERFGRMLAELELKLNNTMEAKLERKRIEIDQSIRTMGGEVVDAIKRNGETSD